MAETLKHPLNKEAEKVMRALWGNPVIATPSPIQALAIQRLDEKGQGTSELAARIGALAPAAALAAVVEVLGKGETLDDGTPQEKADQLLAILDADLTPSPEKL